VLEFGQQAHSEDYTEQRQAVEEFRDYCIAAMLGATPDSAAWHTLRQILRDCIDWRTVATDLCDPPERDESEG
jgi:hypothetical protein